MPQILVELSEDLRKQTFYSKAFILTLMMAPEVYINIDLILEGKKSFLARSYSSHIT